jgi:single-strand DNA-binding protein
MNKVILMGRLTRDPEVRYTNSNMAVCRFTLAVDRGYVKPGEERQADFIPIVTFDKQAEFCSKYFTKGLQVAIVGRIQVSSWDDNEGKKRYTTEVIASETFFADSKRSDGSAKPQGQQQTTQPSDGFYPLEEDDELPF